MTVGHDKVRVDLVARRKAIQGMSVTHRIQHRHRTHKPRDGFVVHNDLLLWLVDRYDLALERVPALTGLDLLWSGSGVARREQKAHANKCKYRDKSPQAVRETSKLPVHRVPLF